MREEDHVWKNIYTAGNFIWTRGRIKGNLVSVLGRQWGAVGSAVRWKWCTHILGAAATHLQPVPACLARVRACVARPPTFDEKQEM